MILKISWRNIWRSPLRSLVVMGSIMVGTWSIITLLSFSFGLVKSYVNNAIRFETSHLQIHNPAFRDDPEVESTLPEAEEKLAEIREDERVASATVRTLVNAMLVAPKGTRGVVARGVERDAEAEVTHIDQQVVEGDYFIEGRNNQILIGQSLAEKLGVGLRKKVVLQFQNMEGDITGGAFRIVGLISSGNKMRDDASVFVQRSDLNRLLGDETAAHEVAVFLKDPEQTTEVTNYFSGVYPQDKVEAYQEISPDVKLYETQIGTSFVIFVGIFMLALIFGIINTMLMAVLERTRELGMLMSVGMNKFRVFAMIVIETMMLGMISALVGLLIGYFTVYGLKDVGLDLSSFAQGLKQFGMSTIIYPSMPAELYGQLALAVLFTSLLASLYPAWKAISLRPVQAVRKI